MHLRNALLWSLLVVSCVLMSAGCWGSPDSDDEPTPTPTPTHAPLTPTPDPTLQDQDSDGHTVGSGDCNDKDPTIYPGAVDTAYDGIDQDCSGLDLIDVDEDGYIATQADGDDCDDNDPTIHPGAPELRNGEDDDCDGKIDDNIELYDSDGDGFSQDEGDCDDEDPDSCPTCEEVPYDGYDQDCDGVDITDVDGDGQDALEADGPDCDDEDEDVYEGADEVPYDNVDQDCDGEDFADVDGDGYDASISGGPDCDDHNAAIHPGATEYSDGKDNDCDGKIDEDLDPIDDDGDGYSEAQGDCNDRDPRINPDATDTPYDGVDQDCTGSDFADLDGDGYDAAHAGGDDCDDEDAAIHPGATELCDGIDNNCDKVVDLDAADRTTYYLDADSDSYGDIAWPVKSCSISKGLSENHDDCDDSDPAVHPGATEDCDGVDDDCDGDLDEGVTTTFYQDADGDGFGTADATTQACTQPSGYVSNTQDCLDSNPTVYPGATESCNGVDDDCDLTIDEAVKSIWYQDLDSDGYGNSAKIVLSCEQPAGYVADGTDCRDTNASVNPAASETCDGVDQDCDGTVDEGVGPIWYGDTDGDTYGAANDTLQACSQPTGYVSDNKDCDDTKASVHPGAAEACNGIDEDCDGSIDEGATRTYYKDADGDGFGTAGSTTQACSAPSGYVSDKTDCNDTVATTYPGAPESCNGVDDDCDGTTDEGVKTIFYQDADKDTYGTPLATTQACSLPSGYVSNNQDCNDKDPNTYPGATEICDSSNADQDCDGAADDNDPSVDLSTGTLWYRDFDSDNYGDKGDAGKKSCDDPSNSSLHYVLNALDCNDSSAAVNPGATENCNGVDEDCDGSTDEGVTTTFYKDADGDGYGTPSSTTQACSVPSGYSTVNTDCNDTQSAINPAAKEICADSIDQDCDAKPDDNCLAKIVISGLSNARNGNLGGIAGANTLCMNEATANGKTGIWKAFLSSSTQGVKDLIPSHMASSIPVVTLNNGDLFANWNAVFAGNSGTWGLATGYLVAFNGRLIDDGTGASPEWDDADGWTGSNQSGTVHSSGQTCGDWTSSSSKGVATELDQYTLLAEETDHACSQTLAVLCVKVSD